MPAPLRSLADFATLVRAARVERNLTQAELAARLGVGTRLLSELEQGERDVRASNLLHILGRLGYDLVAARRNADAGTGAGADLLTPPERQRVRHPRSTAAKRRRGA